jgi:hypothetical protein
VTALLPLGVALADDVNEPTFFSAQVDQGQFGTGVVGIGTFLGGQFSSPNGSGVSTSSNGKGAGISANSRDGLGGEFSGKQAPVRLVPAATAGPPAAASGAHQAGELYVDSAGQRSSAPPPAPPARKRTRRCASAPLTQRSAACSADSRSGRSPTSTPKACSGTTYTASPLRWLSRKGVTGMDARASSSTPRRHS